MSFATFSTFFCFPIPHCVHVGRRHQQHWETPRFSQLIEICASQLWPAEGAHVHLSKPIAPDCSSHSAGRFNWPYRQRQLLQRVWEGERESNKISKQNKTKKYIYITKKNENNQNRKWIKCGHLVNCPVSLNWLDCSKYLRIFEFVATVNSIWLLFKCVCSLSC